MKAVCEKCDGMGEFREWLDDEQWEYQPCDACDGQRDICSGEPTLIDWMRGANEVEQVEHLTDKVCPFCHT